MRWLETTLWTRNIPRKTIDSGTVEHILPRSITKIWSINFTPEDCDKFTNLIGNLCLLDRDANSDLENKAPKEKLDTYKKWKESYLLLRGAMICSVDGKDWTKESIERRTADLAHHAASELDI